MRFASLKSNNPDGQLILVDKTGTIGLSVSHIAPTMQFLMDNWQVVIHDIRGINHEFLSGKLTGKPISINDVSAPLPRAYQWADGSAYLNHVELVRRARGATMPLEFLHDPLMYQGTADITLAPNEPILMADERYGIDFEGEVAVITDRVHMAANKEQAAQAIRLVMICNDVSLRNIIPNELAKGFGFFHGKPATCFAPFAVTLDELGGNWHGYKLHLPLEISHNGALFGRANAGVDMQFDFADLIKHAAKTRHLGAGTIIGSGTISNRGANGGAGLPVAHGGVGYSCIAEIRMIETIQYGAPKTPFLRFGDNITMQMKNQAGWNIFGTINQTIQQYIPHNEGRNQ